MAWHDEYQVWLTESQSLANAQHVVNHLSGTDWSRASICALVGNMRHESSINPDMYEYGYAWSADRGYGLVQWTPRSKYWDWAVANGKDPRDGNSQLDRIDYEVSNNIQWIPRSDYDGMTFAQFRSNSGDWSIEHLTEAFTWGYERPNAQAGWNSMPDRKAFARLAYNELDWTGTGDGGDGGDGGDDGGTSPGDGDDGSGGETGSALRYVESVGDMLHAHLRGGSIIKLYPATSQRWIAEANSFGGGGGSGPGDDDDDDGNNGGGGDPGDVVHGDWANPLDNQRCTQAYGSTSWSSYHSGFDMGAKTPGRAGDPMYAVHGGKVVRTGGHNQVLAYNSGRGLVIDIGEHEGDQVFVYYGHCNSVDVSEGDVVAAGDQVATMGGTGANHSNTDFAVHLHLTMFKNVPIPASGPFQAGPNDTFDPEPYLKSKGLLQEMNACPR